MIVKVAYAITIRWLFNWNSETEIKENISSKNYFFMNIFTNKIKTIMLILALE